MAITQKIRDSKRAKAIGGMISALNPFKSDSKSQKPLMENVADAVAMPAVDDIIPRPAKPRKSHKPHKTQAKAKSHQSGVKAKKKSHHRGGKKKSTEYSENVNAMPHPVMTLKDHDPAHSPGHRKLGVKKQFNEPSGEKTKSQESALQQNSRGDRMARLTTPMIRVQSPSRKISKRGTSQSS